MKKHFDSNDKGTFFIEKGDVIVLPDKTELNILDLFMSIRVRGSDNNSHYVLFDVDYTLPDGSDGNLSLYPEELFDIINNGSEKIGVYRD